MDSHPHIELTQPPPSSADSTESSNECRLFMCSALYRAVCGRRKEKVMALLLQQRGGKATTVDQATGNSCLPLIQIIWRHSQRRSQDLDIQHGQCNVHEVSPDGNNLLHLAAEQGHDELIRELHSRFSDTSLLSSRNSELDTPLHCAARAGRDMTVSLLIQLARDSGDSILGAVGGKNEAGDTALHLAARHGHSAAVEALIAVAPELASQVNNAGVSPLYLAVISRSLPAVKAITTRCRDASAVGPNSQNTLHAAVLQGLEMVSPLLQWKPSLADEVDGNGSSPLHFASSDGDRSVVSVILRAAPPSMAYKQDSEGLSAFHIAARMGHAHVVKVLMEVYPEAVELRDHRGGKFLHSAAMRGHSEVVSLAIKNRRKLGRLLNAQDRDGNTPLHLAVGAGASKVVKALMSKGKVRADVMNNDGCTPFDLAMKSSSLFRMISLVVILTAFGANSRPQRQDQVKLWSGRDIAEETKKMSRILAVVAGLIVTVAFSAASNVPGSYNDDDGMANLQEKTIFKCFLVLDSVALITSMLAVILLVYGEASRSSGSWKSLVAALHFFWVSLISMMLAFYAALAAVTCTRAVYNGTYMAIYQLFYILVLIIPSWIAPQASFRTTCKFLWKGSHAVIRRQYPYVSASILNLLLFMFESCLAFFGLGYVSFVAATAKGCSI